MNVWERIAFKIRHSALLDRADWLWDLVRPAYDRLSSILARNGIERTINGTDRVRILPEYRWFPEVYEPGEWRHIMAHLRQDDLVVDVGAFIGVYTVALARRLRAPGRVVAFEPNEEIARALVRHVALNEVEDRVEVRNEAVADYDGHAAFELQASQQSRLAGPHGPGKTQVPCVRLDSLLSGEAPAIVKIDVEGFEEKVLRGAEGILRDPQRAPRLIYIEMHPFNWAAAGTTSASLLGFLADHEYELRDTDGNVVREIVEYGQLVAVRKPDRTTA